MTGRPARSADARLDRLVNRGLRLGGAILVIGAVAMLVAPSAIAPYFGLELGALKASDGSFSYDVPAGLDIDAVGSVVIWCRAFSIAFATASLDAA